MVSGREIAATAARLSVADLSVLISALQQSPSDDVKFTTVEGSENHILWSMMAEKGWLADRGNPKPDLPIRMVCFSIVPEARQWVHAVAVVCFEGKRQGLTAEEIIASGEGRPHPKLVHLF